MYRTLIFDEDRRISEGLKAILPWEKYGHEVCGTAVTLREAVELIIRVKPDVIFTEMLFSDGNGADLFDAAITVCPHLKAVVLTSYKDFETARRLCNAGVVRILTKPTKMAELTEAVEEVNRRIAFEYSAECIAELKNSDTPKQLTPRAGNFAVQQACSYIKDHCKEKITLEHAAAAGFVSKWYLSVLLKQLIGKNFYELLNEARIDVSKDMLKDPGMRIAEVSTQLGFSDPAHFARVFKKIEGETPNLYRRNIMETRGIPNPDE
ncbi:MAG: helix-turn-helix domain-containing protein [Oscillospiraceae bacterium]|jgi:two-component system response regulator YesN|nr:helix-turn-helix domain-containing protein [Oscillospiraceae bacterium]